MLRVDREMSQSIGDVLENELIDLIRHRLCEFQAVLIADYAKGCCTPRLLTSVIEAARLEEIPVLINPARGGDFWDSLG